MKNGKIKNLDDNEYQKYLQEMLNAEEETKNDKDYSE